MIDRRFRILLPLSCLIVVISCDDGPGFWVPSTIEGPPPPPPQQGSYVVLSSETGDFIGAGQDFAYTNADSLITVTAQDAHLTVDIDGDEGWTGEFQLPDSFLALEVGTYTNLTRYPLHDVVVGGLSWFGEGRGCNTLDGSIAISSVTYNGTTLTGIDLIFDQFCDGSSAALHGEIHWSADDATMPAGPVVPPPAGLWEPLQGTTPETGNYIYLASEQGDFIGAGTDYIYTDATAVITVEATEIHLSVSVTGIEGWNGDFEAMDILANLEAGYYGELQRYPFHNPVKGGLSWSGEGRDCNTLTGWFVVDSVTYNGDALTAIDLRFAQHCEGDAPALNGEIHWVQ